MFCINQLIVALRAVASHIAYRSVHLVIPPPHHSVETIFSIITKGWFTVFFSYFRCSDENQNPAQKDEYQDDEKWKFYGVNKGESDFFDSIPHPEEWLADFNVSCAPKDNANGYWSHYKDSKCFRCVFHFFLPNVEYV